ncbi:MAG: nuclear transport factor 2 family protein [Myxococcota bacterium]|nr:nuclear transport factor 2 family protein [Myxococcota bacterium]
MNRPPISRDFAERFVEEWIAAWNAHDLPRILSHYEEDFEMASPRIVEIAGESSGVLRGKASVGAYWEKALRLIPDLRFEKLAVFVGARSIALHYRNQAGRLAVETFEIGETGRVVRAAANYL